MLLWILPALNHAIWITKGNRNRCSHQRNCKDYTKCERLSGDLIFSTFYLPCLWPHTSSCSINNIVIRGFKRFDKLLSHLQPLWSFGTISCLSLPCPCGHRIQAGTVLSHLMESIANNMNDYVSWNNNVISQNFPLVRESAILILLIWMLERTTNVTWYLGEMDKASDIPSCPYWPMPRSKNHGQ